MKKKIPFFNANLTTHKIQRLMVAGKILTGIKKKVRVFSKSFPVPPRKTLKSPILTILVAGSSGFGLVHNSYNMLILF